VVLVRKLVDCSSNCFGRSDCSPKVEVVGECVGMRGRKVDNFVAIVILKSGTRQLN
jgi:hypothetical protein